MLLLINSNDVVCCINQWLWCIAMEDGQNCTDHSMIHLFLLSRHMLQWEVNHKSTVTNKTLAMLMYCFTAFHFFTTKISPNLAKHWKCSRMKFAWILLRFCRNSNTLTYVFRWAKHFGHSADPCMMLLPK